MEVAFRLVDVFCERPFEGNQLCVVPEPPADLNAGTMQTLAKEIGFSETTYVTRSTHDGYAMRIFTPDAELPFAGHPTLGTAFTMVAEGRVTSPLTQEVAAGKIPVEVDVEAGSARMRQLRPSFEPESTDRDLIAAAVGLEPGDLHPDLPAQVVSTGLGPLLIPVRDPEALRRAERDAAAARHVADASGGECLYLFALTEGGVMARMFDPGVGIGEDPATGSAAGPLGAYLASRGLAGLPGRVEIRQGEQVGRPSVLVVDIEAAGDSWTIHVGGGVAIVGEGSFRL